MHKHVSHPDLKGYYTKFGQLVGFHRKKPRLTSCQMENAEKQTSLAVNIGMLCRHVMLFISDIYLLPQRGAILFTATLPECILHIGWHRLYVCPKFHGQGGKEDLLKYFNRWNGITPGAYEGLLRGKQRAVVQPPQYPPTDGYRGTFHIPVQ